MTQTCVCCSILMYSTSVSQGIPPSLPLQLSLLDTHIQQLQKQLQLVTGVNEREDPFLVLGNHTHPNNPLHPQEQVMNKYAVVVS